MEEEPVFKVEDVEEETYPYEFDFYESDYQTLDLDSAVYQALGAASTCWESLAGTGEFNSEHAVIIGKALIEKIKESAVTVRSYRVILEVDVHTDTDLDQMNFAEIEHLLEGELSWEVYCDGWIGHINYVELDSYVED